VIKTADWIIDLGPEGGAHFNPVVGHGVLSTDRHLD
jgi:excinuclease UvrABC ATPase subunit